MKRFFFVLVFLIACCWSGNALGDDKPEIWGVDVIAYGTYQITGQEMLPEGGIPGGRVHWVNRAEFRKQTFEVPAVLGTRFGFRYVINGVPAGAQVPIVIRKIYPGLKDPARKEIVYGHEYTRNHKIGETYGTGYGFDHPWELVSGPWTFQLLYRKKILAELTFKVYNPH